MKRRFLVFLAVLASVPAFFAVEWYVGRDLRARVLDRFNEAESGSVTLLSRTHTLDRIYMSMQGPFDSQRQVRLIESGEPELLWITGIHTTVVDAEGNAPVSREFFCHSNLTLNPDWDPDRHNSRFGDRTHLDWRIFTLVPGRLEITLPSGFGIPVYSDESLDYLAMSLNLNVPDRTETVRFRTTVDYVRDSGTDRPMKPLFRRAIYGFEPIHGESDLTMCRSAAEPGESCGPFLGVSASATGFIEDLGENNTIHWMVPPGQYRSKTRVTRQLNLPFDTTVHYVTAHLHPYGTRIVLRDLTRDEDVFTIASEDFQDRVGVAVMEEISIPEGIQLYRNHEYELITEYDNPTEENIDAMAIMYLYLLENDLDLASL